VCCWGHRHYPSDGKVTNYPRAMTDREAEYQQLVTMLEEAGLAEAFVNDDGKDAIRLTERGTQLGHAMAMAGDEADAEAMLAAQLEGGRDLVPLDARETAPDAS